MGKFSKEDPKFQACLQAKKEETQGETQDLSEMRA